MLNPFRFGFFGLRLTRKRSLRPDLHATFARPRWYLLLPFAMFASRVNWPRQTSLGSCKILAISASDKIRATAICPLDI